MEDGAMIPAWLIVAIAICVVLPATAIGVLVVVSEETEDPSATNEEALMREEGWERACVHCTKATTWRRMRLHAPTCTGCAMRLDQHVYNAAKPAARARQRSTETKPVTGATRRE